MDRTFKAALLALLVISTPGMAAEHDYVFEGEVDFSHIGEYIYLDFTVPEGTTKISFNYSYAPVAVNALPESAGDSTAALISDVIDIGVFDADGYRGWSGSNKHNFSIAKSKAHTSDSYIPGPMPAGTWRVELGVGMVEPGHLVAYTVNIDLSDEDVGDEFIPSAYEPVVLSNEARWYKGDLHCHSKHSDGSGTMEETFDFAQSQGLDFIALSDHNAISHYLYIPDYQPLYGDLLLLYACELTSYQGHINVFNVREYVPYQGTAPDYDINAVADMVHSLGGFISPNHPAVPGIPTDDHIHGMGYFYPDTDWSKIDFMEAVNGPSSVYGGIPNPINFMAIQWWDDLQNQGYPITIRGGSDDHNSGQGGGDLYAPIGVPTTVVYAEELSADAIFDAIAAGHTYLSTLGPDGPELYLTATDGRARVIVGDTIAGESITLEVHVVGALGMDLRILENGVPMHGHNKIAVTDNDFSYTVELTPTEPVRYRAELHQGIILAAITNSLYVEPPAPADDDADDDTDDDTDDDDDDMSDDDGGDDDAHDDASDDDAASDDDSAHGDDDDDDGSCCG